jgi:hypothetical protein
MRVRRPTHSDGYDNWRGGRRFLLQERLVLFLKEGLLLELHLIGAKFTISSMDHLVMISLLADKALWNQQLKEIEELISLHLRNATDVRAEGLVLKNRETKGITRGLERIEFCVVVG